MKTTVRLAMIWALAGFTAMTVSAQKILPQPAPPKQLDHGKGPNNPKQPKGGNPNDKWWISVGVGGGGPNYGPPPPPPNYGYYGGGYGGGYYNNYNNYGYNNYYYGSGPYYGYSYRKAARKTIRNTAYVIFNAIQQANWEGMYNPVLSDAVQHQQFAKYLYNCGDYMGSLYHSRRAGYLAWQSLNFNYGMVQNPGYDGWDDVYGYGGNYNGGGGGYYNDDYYKKNGNGNGGTQPGQQKQADPNVKTPSNEDLDKQIQKKSFTKDEMKNIKLSDLDVN
jgi:hypothetical protein